MPAMDYTTAATSTPWVTIPEGAKYAHCRVSTFRRLCAAGYIHIRHLPTYLVGVTGRTPGLVDTREIDALLRGDSSETNPAREIVARNRIEAETTRGRRC